MPRNQSSSIRKKRNRSAMLLRMMIVLTMLSGSWLSAPPSASADTPLGTIAAGNGPFSAAVNPITNRIYIANEQDSSVTVIDGATNARTTVATLSHPTAIAVNAVTNRIYVTHPDDDKVSVIDGAGNNVTEIIDAGDGPTDIAVNAATNKIYVANRAGDDVTVIDGVDHTTETVAAGDEPYRISVNAVTNKIYVVNTASHNVIVIDGADHSTQTVTVGSLPNAVAVNPITNKIYVTNQGDNSVTVINGADNSTEPPVAVEDSPVHIAVNPVTNKIYAANQGDNSVTVIDGTDNSTERVAAGNGPQFVTVNSVTNKIYVANSLGSDITVVDGASNTPRTIATGDGPFVVVVNAVTNTIYAANRNDDSVTVIDGADNLTETVSRGDRPTVIAVNTLTNRIYVTNFFASTVSVLDGAGNLIETVAAGSSYALAVNFRLLVTGGGRTVEVSDFGGSYMMKSIVLDAGAAKRNYTAVLYDPSAQSFAFVPAVTANRDDGGSESVMRMPHNSIYAVMESPLISFADMQGHWAKPSVEQMATKRIVNGVSNTAYAPDRAITRAEFTALLVRALGIRTEADAAGNAFEDVAASAWYAAAVEAGLRSGLVSGIGGTRFAPEERITREQMAVMLANARALATERAAGAGQTANLPSGFSDAAEVSPWARAAVAEAVAAGIIQGMTPDRLAPAASATRAQAAVMLKRLMEDIGFLEKVSD